MTIESDSSRREFLGALSAGVAAAGSLAAATEATAQGAAPLKIVDFHNHYHRPVLDPDQPRQRAARGAAGLGGDQPQSAEPGRAAVVGRSRRHRRPRDQHADRVHRGRRRQNSARHDRAHQRPDGGAGRKASRQALRPRHCRCLQRRRRRARSHPRGQGPQAARRVRRKRQARPPARRQGDAPDACRRGFARRAGVRASADRPANCTSASRAPAGWACGSRAAPSTTRR